MSGLDVNILLHYRNVQGKDIQFLLHLLRMKEKEWAEFCIAFSRKASQKSDEVTCSFI